MHRRISVLLVAAFLANAISPSLRAGAPSKKAVYRGGTLAYVELSAEGRISTTDPDQLLFVTEGGELRIPWDRINSLEYGQKVGRRLTLAITVSPLLLLAKKRRHFLTIGFLDGDGRQQAAVFELGKKIVRTTLKSLEARTNLRIDYEDEEARRASQR